MSAKCIWKIRNHATKHLNIHPLVWLKPHPASVSIPERDTIPFFMDDLCHTLPWALISVLAIARICGLTIPSETNRHPIVVILSSLMSIEIIFKPLSKVRLLGRDRMDKPHTFITFLLYGKSMERY